MQKTINQDLFNILRKLGQNPNINQRQLDNKPGFSLGKLNYCINELKKKGFIKIENLKKNKRKFGYIYLLTPIGILVKTKLTLNFMKRKMIEYDELQNEILKNVYKKK